MFRQSMCDRRDCVCVGAGTGSGLTLSSGRKSIQRGTRLSCKTQRVQQLEGNRQTEHNQLSQSTVTRHRNRLKTLLKQQMTHRRCDHTHAAGPGSDVVISQGCLLRPTSIAEHNDTGTVSLSLPATVNSTFMFCCVLFFPPHSVQKHVGPL